MAEPAVLLVHGSCHGAWCWRDVIPALAARGVRGVAIDLPGHGADPTPRASVTLEDYATAIVAAAENLDGGRPVTILGHSMAGYAISAAAVRRPDLVARLVFLCAYVPEDGRSLADMRRAGPRQPLAGVIRVDAAAGTFDFDPAQQGAVFYHDCSSEDVAFAAAHLTPQPIRPQETPLALSPAWHGIEKHYIRCADDRVIPPEYQVTMARDFPPGRVSVLESSHSPFLSMPGQLAERIATILGA